MTISGLLFINTKGEVIISRYFRDNISRSAADAFRTQVIAAKKGAESVPIINIDKVSFLYCRQNDVYLVAATKTNANAPLIFSFLYKMIEVFRAYFGGHFDEETVRNNFVLIYELLDECNDYGYPQITAVNILSVYIKHGEVRGDGSDGGCRRGERGGHHERDHGQCGLAAGGQVQVPQERGLHRRAGGRQPAHVLARDRCCARM